MKDFTHNTQKVYKMFYISRYTMHKGSDQLYLEDTDKQKVSQWKSLCFISFYPCRMQNEIQHKSSNYLSCDLHLSASHLRPLPLSAG